VHCWTNNETKTDGSQRHENDDDQNKQERYEKQSQDQTLKDNNGDENESNEAQNHRKGDKMRRV